MFLCLAPQCFFQDFVTLDWFLHSNLSTPTMQLHNYIYHIHLFIHVPACAVYIYILYISGIDVCISD